MPVAGSLALALLVACGDKDSGEPGSLFGDDTAADTAADTGLCADAPVLTWENFGDGFLTENCQTCHASTAVDRNGAPEEISFDTKEDALALSDRILARSTGEDADMPPEGGVSEDERYKLEIWLTCWE